MPRNPTAAQRAALAALFDKYGPLIRAAFEEAFYRGRARVDFTALMDALERGDLGGATEMFRMEQGDFSALREAVRQTYMAGGDGVRGLLPRAIVATYGFDGQNPRASAWIEQRGAALVQGITEDSQAATRRAILDVLESQQERSLRSAALDITGRRSRLTGRREGGILGLTAEQTDWAISARQELHSLDRHYFTRALRDRRYDPMVRRAIESGEPLTQAQIDKITGRYKDKMLRYRGEMIAQHEAFQALAASREEAMAQVLQRPDVETVTKKWQLGFPREHRQNHVALADQVISFDGRFDLGNGVTARCPHDSDLPISETAGCRCSCVYRVKLRRGA